MNMALLPMRFTRIAPVQVKTSKNGKPIRNTQLEDSSSYQWLRQLVDTLREGDNPEYFLEHTRLELFQDQVFTFTPNGGLIVLPHGATPIDFAYSVHTDIGNTCYSCKINGRPMPLVTILKNGDEVEIKCAPGHKPPAAWENIAVTGKAKAAIRRCNTGQYSGAIWSSGPRDADSGVRTG